VEKLISVRIFAALLAGCSAAVGAAESDERALDSERRAVEAEGRAVAAERRALEAERRVLEADRNASGGPSRAPSVSQPEACQAATSRYERICSTPSRNVIGDAPECACTAAASAAASFPDSALSQSGSSSR
jgi:hypothetical protein